MPVMPWNPLHPDHAIEQVVATIAFTDAVTPKFLQSVADKVRPIAEREGLGHNIEIKGLSVSIGPSPSSTATTPMPGGFAFQRQTNGRLMEALQFLPAEFKYTSSDYRRWADFRKRFEELAVPGLN